MIDKRKDLPCAVVKDLLPLYHDGVVNSDTRDLIEAHLEGCESCRNELETNYFIVEGLRMLDTDSDDIDVKGTMDRAIRSAYQRLRTARGWKIVLYSVNTLVFLSVIGTLLLELRILFYR